MNYLLYGENVFLIKQYINDLIKKEKMDEVNINRYNLDNDILSKVIEDASTISLFDNQKLIIVDNCSYFNRVKNSDDDIALLNSYLTNYNPNTIMIFISHNPTIDNTKKITKLLKSKGQIVAFNDVDLPKTVKNLFKGYEITDNAINLLISRVGNDLELLSQEITKIKIYKIDDKKVSEDDILTCSSLNIDTDIYKFVDNIINKRKDMALKTYYELLKQNDDAASVIALLASKFRLMYQSIVLAHQGLNNNEIATTLAVHPYRVKLALEEGRKYQKKILLDFILKLANLDNDIKTGKINAELGVELFILNV